MICPSLTASFTSPATPEQTEGEHKETVQLELSSEFKYTVIVYLYKRNICV